MIGLWTVGRTFGLPYSYHDFSSGITVHGDILIRLLQSAETHLAKLDICESEFKLDYFYKRINEYLFRNKCISNDLVWKCSTYIWTKWCALLFCQLCKSNVLNSYLTWCNIYNYTVYVHWRLYYNLIKNQCGIGSHNNVYCVLNPVLCLPVIPWQLLGAPKSQHRGPRVNKVTLSPYGQPFWAPLGKLQSITVLFTSNLTIHNSRVTYAEPPKRWAFRYFPSECDLEKFIVFIRRYIYKMDIRNYFISYCC